MTDEQIRKLIARRVREARKAAGMKQTDLAEAIHVTSRKVSSWERGETAVLFSDAVAVAEATGRDLNDLCSWWEWHDKAADPAKESYIDAYDRADEVQRSQLERMAEIISPGNEAEGAERRAA